MPLMHARTATCTTHHILADLKWNARGQFVSKPLQAGLAYFSESCDPFRRPAVVIQKERTMNRFRQNMLTPVSDGPWKFPHLDNHTKVKLGVGLTIGSSIVAMLMMAHA